MNLNANHLSDSELTIGTVEHLGRFRPLKRLLARLLRPFFGYQIYLNRSFSEDLVRVGQALEALERSLAGVPQSVEEVAGRWERLDSSLAGVRQSVEEVASRWERLDSSLAGVRQSVEEVASRWELLDSKIDLVQRQSFARYHEGVASLREDINELLVRFAELPHQSEVAEISRNVALAVASEMNNGLSDRARRALAEVRSRLSQYDLLLDTVRRNLPEPVPPTQLAASSPDALGVLYEALEESFRGPREEIVERVRAYVGDILACVPSGPVLDVGCGRGELLEVLASAGIEAYGVDTNPALVDKVRARGLDARLMDARAHLAALEPESLRAVTALHLVEHLGTQDLLLMLDAVFQALRHGGLLILETPNPENLIVGSSTFYLDPTHRVPLPPALLAFLVESRGFSDVDIRYPMRQMHDQLSLPQDQEPWGPTLRPLVEAVNQHLFAPPDYTLLAWRL